MKRTLLLLAALLTLLLLVTESSGAHGGIGNARQPDEERLVVFEIFTRPT